MNPHEEYFIKKEEDLRNIILSENSSFLGAFNNMFNGHDKNIGQLMINEKKIDECYPMYREDLNYQQMYTDAQNQIKANLSILKDNCFTINMLKTLQSTAMIYAKNMNQFKKRKRVRRTNIDLKKSLECPFLGCDKVYATRTALKCHIRLSHKIDDPPKKNQKQCLLSIITPTSRKGVDEKKVIIKKKVDDSTTTTKREESDEEEISLSKFSGSHGRLYKSQASVYNNQNITPQKIKYANEPSTDSTTRCEAHLSPIHYKKADPVDFIGPYKIDNRKKENKLQKQHGYNKSNLLISCYDDEWNTDSMVLEEVIRDNWPQYDDTMNHKQLYRSSGLDINDFDDLLVNDEHMVDCDTHEFKYFQESLGVEEDQTTSDKTREMASTNNDLSRKSSVVRDDKLIGKRAGIGKNVNFFEGFTDTTTYDQMF